MSSWVIEVPKRLRWQLPPEERRLSGPSKDLICEPFYLQTLFVRYIYELSEKAISWFFPVPDNRECDMDCADLQSTMTHRLVHNVFLCSPHPAAGGREQEVILLICGRISTQGVYFGREIDESVTQISSGNGTSWTVSRLITIWTRRGPSP